MEGKHEICRMQILVVAATHHEIAPFIAGNKGVDILVTGIGVPATIYQLQKKIYSKPYDFIIQAGIAGAFSSNLTLGEVVLVEQDSFADLGMEERGNFTSIFNSAFMDEDEFPFCKGWLVNKTPVISTLHLPLVKGVTVNKVSDSMVQRQQIIGNFSPQTESMEGAAFHYVCLQEKIAFMQVRSISNYVGERDKTKWKMKESILNLNEALFEIINRAVDIGSTVSIN